MQHFWKQEYSEIGNNNTAFLVTRVQHWITEQVRSVAVHLKVIQAVHLIRYGVLAKVIGHFFAKVNGHRGGSEFAITE